jgi:putative ABC transport system permease protein
MNSDLFLDIRMALRAWRRRPGLISAVVVTLTAGLGAAIGVFSITYAVLWRPIDVPDPDNVVTVRTVDKGVAGASSPGAALTWQARARTAAETAIVWRRTATFIDGRGADRLDGVFASPELFTIFGVAAVEGRTFTRDRRDSQRLLISERLWRSRYAQQRIEGEAITLNGQPYTVVGVLPSRVSELLGASDWIAPLQLPPSQVANFGPRYRMSSHDCRLAPASVPRSRNSKHSCLAR